MVPRLARGIGQASQLTLNRITLALEFNLRCPGDAQLHLQLGQGFRRHEFRFGVQQRPRCRLRLDSNARFEVRQPLGDLGQLAIDRLHLSGERLALCHQIVKLLAGQCKALGRGQDLLQRTQLALQVGHLRLEPFHPLIGFAQDGPVGFGCRWRVHRHRASGITQTILFLACRSVLRFSLSQFGLEGREFQVERVVLSLDFVEVGVGLLAERVQFHGDGLQV